MKPRVLLVGRRRYRLPLVPSEARKFEALRDVMELRVLGSGAEQDDTFRLVRPFPVRALDGLAFHLALPFRVAREIRAYEPDVVLVQGAQETAAALAGRALSKRRPRVVLDLHGDWRTATRLYGSRARRVLSPVGDRLAAWAVRRADGVRTVSDFTTRLVREQGVEPTATFAAFMDLDPFLPPPVPLPRSPSALFVGALELYKGVDVLASAWPEVRTGELRVVGKGPRADLIESLGVRHDRELSPEGVARALDDATCLVLPSRGEGMGRVVVEALLRGRPVVGTRGGGIEDLVRDGENGLLVAPDDPQALADALERVLSDRALAELLARAARPSVEPWVVTPEEYASRLRALIELDSR
jgi:glycosyltransferase involved in cell wall biosynthesis